MSMKILICDDAGFVREILNQSLLELGHVVIGFARDGEEAVKEARRLKPDLILMDLVLPLKNGCEAAREIKEFSPQTPIVALSTTDESFLQAKAQQAGCDAWMAKPFTKLQLKIILETFSAGRKNQEVRNG